MKRYVRLSYDIDEKTPLYPDVSAIVIKQVKEIQKGDSSNTFLMTLPNHAGTHIDAPKHFHGSGRTISEYSIHELIFKNPVVVDCPKGPVEIIEVEDLINSIALTNLNNCDLLLIRTGFYKYRILSSTLESQSFHTYCYENPVLLPSVAKWIRKNHPNIKAIGIDCFSISSYANRELGRETHRILLREDKFTGSSVLIIEDMDLSMNLKTLREVIVAPLYIKGVDSAPCTVIGIIE